MTSGDNIYIYRVTGHMLVYYLTSRMLWLCRIGVPYRRGVELHLVGAGVLEKVKVPRRGQRDSCPTRRWRRNDSGESVWDLNNFFYDLSVLIFLNTWWCASLKGGHL